MADIVVDVVAIAACLGQPVRKPKQEAPSLLPQGNGVTCPLGHRNAIGARFCAECGLAVGEMVLASRVDLEAVREAVKPSALLDQAERDRRDREHLEAMAANLRAEQEVQDIAAQEDPSEKKVLIHFLIDGFTWAGRVWNAGDELEIGPEHPRWTSVLSWIRLSKVEQFHRYGKVFFDYGPYPGRLLAPGQEALLPTAAVSQWAVMRGGIPARPSPEHDGSLVPR